MDNDRKRFDEVRTGVLDKMEAGDRLIRFVMGAGAVLELAMLAACILLVDWGDRQQVLLFAIFLLSYFILVLGLLGLAAHVTKSTARILAVLAARDS